MNCCLFVCSFSFCDFPVRRGFAVRLRCKGVDPDDHPVKKELVSVCNTRLLFLSVIIFI